MSFIEIIIIVMMLILYSPYIFEEYQNCKIRKIKINQLKKELELEYKIKEEKYINNLLNDSPRNEFDELKEKIVQSTETKKNKTSTAWINPEVER